MKVVRVWLDDGSIDVEELDEVIFRGWLGGRGLGLALLAKIKSAKDPLDPQSPLIIAPGFLAGYGLPLANRLTMVFRSPLTRTIAWTHTGGYVAAELASHNIAALIIEGRASNTSYILLDRYGIKVVEAESLRNFDAVETTAFLKIKHGDARVLAVGPAGIRCLPIATVINDMGRSSGVRHGAGAVFGSKNLKALVVKRGDITQKPRDLQSFNKHIRKLHAKLRESTLLNHEKGLLAVYGTSVAVDVLGKAEAIPVKNFSLTSAEKWWRVGGHVLHDSILVGRLTCSKCPVSCRRDSISLGVRGEGPDYAQISSLGTNCMVFDVEKIAYMTQLCYGYGIDPIEVGNTLAVYMELSEKGVAEKKLAWGDFEAMCKMIYMMAYGVDVGEILCKGGYHTATAYGDHEIAPAVKGITIQNTDPRVEHAWGLVNAVESFGGAAHIWVYPTIIKSFKGLGIPTIYDVGENIESIAKGVYKRQITVAYLDSLGVCAFSNLAFNQEDYAYTLQTVFGHKFDVNDLEMIGRKILSMEKYLNEFYGIGPEMDSLPKRFTEEPITSGMHKGEICPINELLSSYRNVRKEADFMENLS